MKFISKIASTIYNYTSFVKDTTPIPVRKQILILPLIITVTSMHFKNVPICNVSRFDLGLEYKIIFYLLLNQRQFSDRFPPCTSEFGRLIEKKLEQYENMVAAREWAENETWLPWLPPPGWKLRSSLVAHVHEHKSSVNKYMIQWDILLRLLFLFIGITNLIITIDQISYNTGVRVVCKLFIRWFHSVMGLHENGRSEYRQQIPASLQYSKWCTQ